jgi:hypothetical protein
VKSGACRPTSLDMVTDEGDQAAWKGEGLDRRVPQRLPMD